MRTKQETLDFLRTLQWTRWTKKSLQKKLQDFFETNNKLENDTNLIEKEIDYTFYFTTATKSDATCHFIDIEIYYLKMRERSWFLITETSLLDYVE